MSPNGELESSQVAGALAISDLVIDLLHALDRHDWAVAREALADRLKVDYTSLFGGEPGEPTAEGQIEMWKGLLPGFDATQHLAGPARVRIEGKEAIAVDAVTATHALGRARWVVGGYTDMRLLREGDRWRVRSITLRTAFENGNRGLLRKARARGAGRL
jgi:hypothetical protein